MVGRPRLNQISVVVPTINRQGDALRQATFWLRYGAPVIVVDGSEKPAGALVSRHDGDSLTYVHAVEPLRRRLLRAVAGVNTPYVLLAADDDQFIPSAVGQCISFLDSNAAYGTCKGQAVTFSCRRGRIIMSRSYRTLQGFSITADSSSGRLSQLEDFRAAAVYAVQRTEIFRAAVYAIDAFDDFEDYATASVPEIMFEITSASASGIYCIDRLMWLRNGINPPMWKPELRIRPHKWWQAASKETRSQFVASVLEGLRRSGVESCTEDDLIMLMDVYSSSRQRAERSLLERHERPILVRTGGTFWRLVGVALRTIGFRSPVMYGIIEALKSKSLLPMREFRTASRKIVEMQQSRSRG